MKYRFHLICPRCGKESKVDQDWRVPPPQVNCGDCLMDHVEIIQLKVVKAETLKPQFRMLDERVVRNLVDVFDQLRAIAEKERKYPTMPLLPLMLTVALLLGMRAYAGERVRCWESQITDEYHSYKVDGRKCWAKGRPGKYDPADLYWPVLEPPPSKPIGAAPWPAEHRWIDPQGRTHQE